MKSHRQAAILEIIEQEAVTSQEQLRERLRTRGVEATQATISRDVRDLRLIKRPVDGAYRRASAAVEPEATADGLRTGVAAYFRRQEVVDQWIVLRTDAGQAQPLAVAIDRSGVP